MMSVTAASLVAVFIGFSLSNILFHILLSSELEKHEGLKRLLIFETFPGIASSTSKLPH